MFACSLVLSDSLKKKTTITRYETRDELNTQRCSKQLKHL